MSAEFLVISLLVAAVPGPGVVFAIACAMSQGLRGAIWGAVAGAVGVMPHLVAASVGLSVVLIAHPMLYDGLRILGGGYLIWLALQTWKNRHVAPQAGPVRETGAAIVLRGAMINLLNPKLTLFFVSFLPQFVPVSDPAPARTMALLGLVLVLQTFVVFLAYGAAACWARGAVRAQTRVTSLCQGGIAVLFAGLGFRVLFGPR